MKTATCLGTLTLLWWGGLTGRVKPGPRQATMSACPFESRWELAPAFSNQAKGILPGLQKPMIHFLGEISEEEV